MLCFTTFVQYFKEKENFVSVLYVLVRHVVKAVSVLFSHCEALSPILGDIV